MGGAKHVLNSLVPSVGSTEFKAPFHAWDDALSSNPNHVVIDASKQTNDNIDRRFAEMEERLRTMALEMENL